MKIAEYTHAHTRTHAHAFDYNVRTHMQTHAYNLARSHGNRVRVQQWRRWRSPFACSHKISPNARAASRPRALACSHARAIVSVIEYVHGNVNDAREYTPFFPRSRLQIAMRRQRER